MFGLSRNLYQISQFIIKIVILEVPGQIRILPPQPKRKETPCASLFVLLMENLHQRPPEEVVGSSGAAPPGADAAAALDPQPRHWRAAAHKPGPGMAARQGGSNPSPATTLSARKRYPGGFFSVIKASRAFSQADFDWK